MLPLTLPVPARTDREAPRWTIAAAVALAVALALNTGLGATGGGARATIILPVAFVGVAALAWVALHRFEWFVLLLLVGRSSLDAVKIGGASGGALDPASLLAVLFLVSAGFWLAAQRQADGPLPRTSLHWGFAALLSAETLSVIGSGDAVRSALEVMRMASVAAMFLVVVRLRASGTPRRPILTACLLSTVFPLVYSGFGLLTGNASAEVKGSFTRITSTFQQSNTFSRFLMLQLLLAIAVYRHVSGRARLALGLLIAAGATALVLTYTRSGWMGTAAGLMVVGVLQSRRLLVGVLAVVVVAVVAIPSVSERIGEVAGAPTATAPVAGTNGGDSLDWRFQYWGEVLPLADQNPVTGIGLNMTQSMTDAQKQPHNDFLRAYVEMGLVGLAAYLLFVTSLLRVAVHSVRSARPGIGRGLAVAFAACAAGYILVSFVANVLGSVVVLWYLATFAALAVAELPRRDVVLAPSTTSSHPDHQKGILRGAR